MDTNTVVAKRRGRPAGSTNGNSNAVKPGAAFVTAFKAQFTHVGPDDLAIANEMVSIVQWTATQYLETEGGPNETQIEALTRLAQFAARNLNKASAD